MRLPLAILLLCAACATAQTASLFTGQTITNGMRLSNVATLECVSNSVWGSASSTLDFAKAANTKYATTSNVLASSASACALWMNFKRVGIGTAGTLTAEIRVNAGGMPAGVLYTSDNTVASEAVATNAAAWYVFQFSGVSLAAGTNYWFGVVSSTINSTNYYAATVGAFNSGLLATDDNASGWGNAGARKWYQSLWSNGAQPLFPYTNSMEFAVDFEAGTNGQAFTASLGTNVQFSLAPFSLTRFAPEGPFSNSFSLGAWALPLTNYWRNNVLANSTNQLGLAINHEMGTNYTLLKWEAANNASRDLSFGYFTSIGLTNDEAANFESVYISSTYSATSASAIPLYMPKATPYWTAHGISNGVAVTGNPIYGITAGDTNWITGRCTATNFTMSVWNPSDWSQVGTNSVVGLAGDTRWISFRFDNNWSQAGRTSYVDNLIVTTNLVFPLLPTNLNAIKNVRMLP